MQNRSGIYKDSSESRASRPFKGLPGGSSRVPTRFHHESLGFLVRVKASGLFVGLKV